MIRGTLNMEYQMTDSVICSSTEMIISTSDWKKSAQHQRSWSHSAGCIFSLPILSATYPSTRHVSSNIRYSVPWLASATRSCFLLCKVQCKLLLPSNPTWVRTSCHSPDPNVDMYMVHAQYNTSKMTGFITAGQGAIGEMRMRRH